MKQNYRIKNIDHSQKWIFISDDSTKYWEYDGFTDLIKKIADSCDGTIRCIGDTMYKITGDRFDLTYQWDTLFGIVVIYKHESQLDEIKKYLEAFFN
ncbi:MAG: hypothetical protein QM308_01115 [Bacillota bacterium]|nr:hypothetical protein [Bacillota bacterium]